MALAYGTLIDALEAAPKERPFVTIWRDEEDYRTVDFGQFIELARAQAAHFRANGLAEGETVILIMPQEIELMVAFAGAMMLGAVPAILAYPSFKVEPAKYRAGLAGVTANLKSRLVVLDEEFPPEMLQHVAVGEGARVIRAVPAGGDSGKQVRVPRPDPKALAFIQHSAGTTGLQKGVALRHSAVLRQLDHLTAALKLDPATDRIYSWLPLYHDMGLIACFMLPMVHHVPVVMQSPTEWVMQPGTMLQLITEYRCTIAWVPNFTLQFLARRVPPNRRGDYDLSSLRALINCSEPVRAESMDEFALSFSAYGLKPGALQSSYAMAENVFAVTQSDASSEPRRMWVDGRRFREEHVAVEVDRATEGAVCAVSSGRCLPGNAVRVASGERDLPDGHVGDILICGDSLFDGYYNRPDLSAAALQDGWYRTGDLGFVLDGELYVTGRKKDLIIVAGKNLYPQDIEEIVCSHPAIHDGRAVAFGTYNPDLGTEDIIVVAELEEGKTGIDLEEVERAIRGAIVAELGVAVRAIYLKPPRWIVKSTAGKPARAGTREKLLREHSELAAAAS